jgi:hypothetical protein
MDDRRKAVIVVVLAAITGVGGVLAAEAVSGSRPGYEPAASAARVAATGATTATPQISSPPSSSPSHRPTATPKATPTAAPPWKANWSKPRLVDKEPCGAFAVGIDARSRYHVVDCGLRYSVTNGDGAWTTASVSDPKAQEPLIAFDGNQAYIAYWRLLPSEADTCGGDQPGPSAGVFFRRRTLPDGAWSKAIAFGKGGDHLQAFRVDRGVLHAIVWNGTSGRTFYIRSTQNPVVSSRHRIAADGDVSLRVGDDGRARVAYWGRGGLLYGTFNGSGFSTSKVSRGPTNQPAILALGAGNQPHIVYTIFPPAEGCGDTARLSRAGVYYATMVNGTWTSHRITKQTETASLAVDPGTGRVHVLVGNVLHTKEPNGDWGSARLPKGVDSPVMRLDPATGELLLMYVDYSDPDAESAPLVAITSP